jgi:SAM-dependent methyltransferase/predicted RNA methylase
LIQNNNSTLLTVPAGYDSNIIIPLEFKENGTKSYIVIKNEDIVLQMIENQEIEEKNLITYISSKDMINLLLYYLDKNNDINNVCDIIILSELYPGEIHYEAILSLWYNLEKIYDGIPRLVILNSKSSPKTNIVKFEIENPITPKYEYVDVSRNSVYEEMSKLIIRKIKSDKTNYNMIIIVPKIEEFLPYLDNLKEDKAFTNINIISSNDIIRYLDKNKTILITTPDKVAYIYLPNTKYVFDSMLQINANKKYENISKITSKQHESLINVPKIGLFIRMCSLKNYESFNNEDKLDKEPVIDIIIDILKLKISPESILKHIDKNIIAENVGLVKKLNLIDIPKLANFISILNLSIRNSAFLWYWIRGNRFDSKIIEEGKKYDINFEEIEIDESSLFSSIEPYHIPSIDAIFDLENVNPESIIDATANIGGDSINFMRLFPNSKLVALEIDTKISHILRRNMDNLKNILSQNQDYDVKSINMSAVKYFSNFRYADMIYFDPPWGGRDYIKLDKISLYLDNISIGKIIKNILSQGMTQLVILKLPINADIDIIKSDINIDVTYSLYNVDNYNKNKIAYQLLFIRSNIIKPSQNLSEDPEEVELIPTTNPVFEGIVIASIIDSFDNSYFEFPFKSRNYTQSQYNKILVEHKKKYFDKYIGYNDLDTFLNMWNDYMDHDDVDTWCEVNSINCAKISTLIATVYDISNILSAYFDIAIEKFNGTEAVKIARPILASIYSDTTYIDIYRKSYFNELKPSEKYSLDKIESVNEMIKNPPLGVIALHTKIFTTKEGTLRLITFGVDTDKTGRGLPIMKRETKNVIAIKPKRIILPTKISSADILKQNPFDILDDLIKQHKINPIILKSIKIDENSETLLKIAKKITGSKDNDLIKILEKFQNVNIDTSWASKTIKSNDRFDDILQYISTDDINLYLDIGSGDAVDFNFMVNKIKPKRSISVDIKDSRLDKSFEFYLLQVNQPLLLADESVDIITIFHALHHSSDALFRLRDIYRLLKTGGLFILKDHDVSNSDIANIVSFEHFVYSIGEGTATIDNAKNYNDIEPMYYYSADYIKNYLINIGFEVIMFNSYNNSTHTYKAIFRKKVKNLEKSQDLEKEYVRYTYVDKILKLISDKSTNTYETRNSVERWLLSMANFSEDHTDSIFSKDILEEDSRFNIQLKKELIEKSGFNSKSADKIIIDIIKIVQEFLDGKYKIDSDVIFTIEDGLFIYKDYSRQITPERMQFLKSLGSNHEIAKMLLRYASILPGSQHWNMPIETFREYYNRGIRTEGFASPINAQLITIDKQNCRFCSLFPDVDKPFGSIGNFFTTDFQGQSVSVGPPYTVELFDKIAIKLENECLLAERNNNKVLFYVTFSAWEDTQGFQAILNSKYTHFAAILPAGTHFYINSNLKKETEVKSPFNTVFLDVSVGHEQLDHTHLFDSMAVGNIKLEILKS